MSFSALAASLATKSPLHACALAVKEAAQIMLALLQISHI